MSMAGKESFGGTEKSVPLLKSSSSNENHGKNKVDESLALTIRSEKDATVSTQDTRIYSLFPT